MKSTTFKYYTAPVEAERHDALRSQARTPG